MTGKGGGEWKVLEGDVKAAGAGNGRRGETGAERGGGEGEGRVGFRT